MTRRAAVTHRAALVAAIAAAACLVAALGSVSRASASRASASRASTSRASTKRAAARPVPQGFVGVDIDGPVTNPGTTADLSGQMDRMVSAGVETVRVAFNWAAAEPYPSMSKVPAAQRPFYTIVGGVPVNFAPTDQIVAAAARHHIAVLPTILYAPPWDAVDNPGGADYPRTPGPYAAYAAALVGRYGPHGSFWSQNPSVPRRPITEWQIWNEPNLHYYWRQPFAAGYVALLRAAHTAIKRADPHATIVLGSLTNLAWLALETLQRRRGFSSLYDVAAVNAYTEAPANVIRYLRYVRRALDRGGHPRTPILATELSWPSAVGHAVSPRYDFDTTRAGQARDIAAVLPLLGAQRRSLRLAGFDYYTWLGTESGHPSNPFAYAGLLADEDGAVKAKPALAAYTRAALRLEGCVAKGPLATDCRR